jgi:hypothetical protein
LRHGGTDACLSGDPGGTNGNITDLSAHFESAKQALVAQPQPVVSTDEDAAKTITLSAADEDGDDLSFFIRHSSQPWDPRADRRTNVRGYGTKDLLRERHLHAG